MENSKNLAVVILAAGSSTRMGRAKQIVEYKGESLLEIAVKKALNISSDVYVVLGREKEKCEERLKGFRVNTVFNENYKNGIGSSISFGISHTKEFENTMIILADQPFISLEHLKSLKKGIKENSVVASKYSSSPSVPAIFSKKYYSALMELSMDKGAKGILKREDVLTIELKKDEAIDIDLPEDIENYLV